MQTQPRPLDRQAIADLITWTHNPTSSEEFQRILDSLTLKELNFLALSDNVLLARIAWVEFARRRGIIGFKLQIVEVGDGFEFLYNAEALAVSEPFVA